MNPATRVAAKWRQKAPPGRNINIYFSGNLFTLAVRRTCVSTERAARRKPTDDGGMEKQKKKNESNKTNRRYTYACT